MKKDFYYTSYKNSSLSPLDVYELFHSQHLCQELFYSGTKEGKYSFLPLKTHANTPNEHFSSLKNGEYFLKNKQKKYNLSSFTLDIPFCGGLVTAISYDYALENTLTQDNSYFSFTDVFLVFHHTKKEILICGWFSNKSFWKQYAQRIQSQLKRKEQSKQNEQKKRTHNMSLQEIVFTPLISKEKYIQAFTNVQRHIEKGNSFQVNLSQGFTATKPKHISSFEIFKQATIYNPAPMMCFFEWELEKNHKKIYKSLISCSPERLFSLNKKRILCTQPIAGTRKLTKNPITDAQREHELKHSEKEHAEHAMIVDLLRNDFGKIAEFGSVSVHEFARIEKYETVMHLVSEIKATLTHTQSAFDVFTAMFPGGTITGTPKKETMTILQQEEIRNRGYYCGSVGYFSLDGQADFNILIRTLEQTDN